MVQFNEVEIIEFPIILGDHPSCQEGPALQMATSCQSRIVVDVEEYEAVRSCCRRYSRDLVLTCEERYQRLQQNGVKLNNNSRKSSKSKKNKVTTTTMNALDEQHEQRLCDINDQLEKLMARLESLNTEASKSCCDSYETETSCSSSCCPSSADRCPPTATRSAIRSDRDRVTVMARCA